MKPNLTINRLKNAAKDFCQRESEYPNPDLYGVTDGKAVGTYIEHKFQDYLSQEFSYAKGSSARGIDLPGRLNTNIKVTSITQPQSSCPFKDAKQKIFGLGYNLLVIVYQKEDEPKNSTAKLDFLSCIFLDKKKTGDYTITYRLREMIDDGAAKEDITAFLSDRNIPADEIMLDQIAKQVLNEKPEQRLPFHFQCLTMEITI